MVYVCNMYTGIDICMLVGKAAVGENSFVCVFFFGFDF